MVNDILSNEVHSCKFITLTDYNDEPGTTRRAQCRMRRDQPFVASEKLFVSCESWRISASPAGENSIYYRKIPKDYYIQVDWDTPKESTNTNQYIPLEKTMITDVTVNQGSGSTVRGQVRISATNIHHSDSVDVTRIVDHMAGELNPDYLANGTILKYENDELGETNPRVCTIELLTNPLHNLQGSGFGPKGLLPIWGRISSLSYASLGTAAANNYEVPVTGQPAQPGYWVTFDVPRLEFPNLSITDLQVFLSKGVYLFRADRADVVTRGYVQVLGPMFFVNDDLLGTVVIAGTGRQSPVVQFYTKENTFFQPNEVIYWKTQDPADATKIIEANSIVSQMPAGFVVEEHVNGEPYFRCYLSCMLTNEGASEIANGIQQIDTYPANKFFVYTSHDELSETVSTEVSFATSDADPQPCEAPSNESILRAGFDRLTMKKRATEDTPFITYSPLDFFAFWNTGFGIKGNPYVLQTSPSGGFRITALDAMTSFKITKRMVEEMGLQPYFLREANLTQQPDNYEYTVAVRRITRTDNPAGVPSWKYDFNYGQPQSIISEIQTFPMTNFTMISYASGDNLGPVDTGSTVGTDHIVRDVYTGEYYTLVGINLRELTEFEMNAFKHYPSEQTDSEGIVFYEWSDVASGSYMETRQEVSVASYAEFEALSIVVSSGFAFDPMLRTNSGHSRALTELRLPLEFSCSVKGGDSGDGGPLLLQTESSPYGELIWSTPANIQYREVRSAGGIYDFTVECRLHKKDPHEPSVVLHLAESNIFEVKLRFVNKV